MTDAPMIVRVKPLVWRYGENTAFIHAGEPNGISYTMMPTTSGLFRVYGIPGDHDNAAQFDSLEAAKAAAQADYEARILAALDLTPDPRVAALVEALEALDRAVSEVTRYGAQTGSQWTRLSIASLKFRAALTAFKGGAQ